MSRTPQFLILKFGGAALGTPARIRRAARRVAWLRAQGHDLVVVASAVGQTTDRLLSLAEKVRSARSEVRGARSQPSSPDFGPRTSDREHDRILATGEDLAASLLATAISALGAHARSLRGGEAGLLATGDFGAGVLQDLALSPLLDLLRAQVIPVVSGFQAVRLHDRETITLGRGTSDLTAVFLAARLRAAECHLIKDVEGVFDVDPNRFADARRQERLSYAELEVIAARSEIVHARAAALAREHGVHLRIYGHKAPFRITEAHCTRVGEAA
jgi:aspartate kinase